MMSQNEAGQITIVTLMGSVICVYLQYKYSINIPPVSSVKLANVIRTK